MARFPLQSTASAPIIRLRDSPSGGALKQESMADRQAGAVLVGDLRSEG
jgi:hypothetical protein